MSGRMISVQFQLAMHSEYSTVSRTSLRSKKNSSLSKPSPLTSSSLHFKSGPLHPPRTKHSASDPDSPASHHEELEAEVHLLEQQQAEMERKFQRCLDYMLAEIDKNREGNDVLGKEVAALRAEVEESRRDILVLEEYMAGAGRGRGLERERGGKGAVWGKEAAGSCSGLKKTIQRRAPLKLFGNKLTLKS